MERCDLEKETSLNCYIKSEWKWLLAWGVVFSLGMLVFLLLVPVEFFYSRMSCDPLFYYLKGVQFAKHFNGQMKVAENLPQFQYVGWPGYLRFPIFYIFNDFNHCLRAIQITNVLIAIVLSVFFSFHLCRISPVKYHKWIILLSYIILLVTNYWPINIILPLGDSIFTLISLITIEILRTQNHHQVQYRHGINRWLLIAFLIALTTLIKITGIFLIIFVIFSLKDDIGIKRKTFLYLVGSIILANLICIVILFPVIHSYFKIWIERSSQYSSMAMSFWFANFILIALPSQIIPHLGYAYPGQGATPISLVGNPHFLMTLGVIVLGFTISLVIALGMWNERRRMKAEVWYFLAGLPIYLPITTSTLRYLSYSQVFIWLFFLGGLLPLIHTGTRMFPRIFRYKGILLPILAVAFGGSFLLRVAGAAGSDGARFSQYLNTFRGDADVYRGLAEYLQSVPKMSTRILLCDPNFARWGAISGLTYYAPDDNLAMTMKHYNVLLVVDGLSKDQIPFEVAKEIAIRSLAPFGQFALQEKFRMENKYAHAVVYSVQRIPGWNH